MSDVVTGRSSSLGTLPDPLLQANFDDPQKKKDPEYGRTLLSRIYKEQNSNTSTHFYGGRNIRWKECWDWAKGVQDMKEMLDLVSIDGNKSYVNIDTTPDRTGPKFVETIINSYSNYEEYPCVRAIDDGSMSEKERRKQDALVRMYEVHTINDIQSRAGIQVAPPNVYVPNDELSAEVYFKLEDRLPKEILFEERIEKVMLDNEYPMLKRRLLRDLIVVNCAVTKIEKLDDGFVGIRKCIPANVVYNFFMSDSGKMELSYIGEVYSLKVSDLRKKYGKNTNRPNGLSEKEIFEMAKTASTYNVSNRWYYYWNNNYIYSTDRPYDDYVIEVFDCEIRMFDADYYVSKVDNYGKENITPKKGIPKPTSEKATVVKTDKITWYRGIWATKADKMIYWGLPDIVIRPFMDITQSLSSYTINIPSNDGGYIPSLFERALEPLRERQVCKLKFKQLIANMAPAGYSLDVEGIRDVDLGDGKSIPWTEILKIRNQSGVVVWSSRGLDPLDRDKRPPIEGLPNAEGVTQLNELSNVMDRNMNDIRLLLGVPIYREGGDVGDRTSGKLAEVQAQSSNNVTDYVYRGYAELMQETLYKCLLLKWDETILSGSSKDVSTTDVFQVSVEMKPTVYEKQMLEQNIQVAMKSVDRTGKPLLSFKDAFKIRNIKNYKLAEMYLANMIETNERKSTDESERLQKQNADIQQQSAQQAAQSQLAQQQQKLQFEEQMENNRSKNKKEELALEGILGIFQKGLTLNPQLQQILNVLVPNIAIPLQMENHDMAGQLEQAAAQEQEQAQQGGQPMSPDNAQPGQEGSQPDQSQQQPMMPQNA